MTSSSQLQDLDQYLARHRSAPNPGNSAWLDRNTGQQIIRVLHAPGETTLPYCLALLAITEFQEAKTVVHAIPPLQG
jgi:hypothetical protein